QTIIFNWAFPTSSSPLKPLQMLKLKNLRQWCHSPFHVNLRALKQSTSSLEEDIYDPPFTPIHKPSKPSKKPHPQNPINSSEYQNPTFQSDLPFDFRYSYSETNPSIKPIGFREPPRFSPFGPGRLDRKWTGTSAPVEEVVDMEKVLEERKLVIGEPLSDEEIEVLVEKYRHSDCNRQINLGNTHSYHIVTFGKGGVTHNLLDDIHNHWKRAEAVRIKCLGAPTLDMDNVCYHLEDKTGGRVIYRNINILLLYRGRNYDPKERPVIPLMLWKPLAPIFPKLVKNVAEGLTFEETKEMRNRGLNAPALMKLTRNGVYVYVVAKVREAFKTEEELVPCVPILFKDSQIILWRGKDQEQSENKNPDALKE
ncbi:hypothetical protein IFM89_020659, partial [Coptis chinensis]